MALSPRRLPFLRSGLLGLALLLSAQQSVLQGQQDSCDKSIDQSSKDKNGYRQRGDRCEGVYIQGVSSPALRVVSLVESFAEFDLADTVLQVAWDSIPAGVPVHLRANALRPHLYYRFDAIRPVGSTSYRWPTAMLRSLELTKRDLGVLAWYPQPVGSSTRDVYLPIRIGQQPASASAKRYVLVLVPGAELSEVFLSLAPVNAQGQPGTFVMQDKPLQRGFYPAGRGITIPISGLTTRGVHYLEISATLRAGGSATTRLWFYHSGE